MDGLHSFARVPMIHIAASVHGGPRPRSNLFIDQVCLLCGGSRLARKEAEHLIKALLSAEILQRARSSRLELHEGKACHLGFKESVSRRDPRLTILEGQASADGL